MQKSLIVINRNGSGTRVSCTACGWSSTRSTRIIDAFDHTLFQHGHREHMGDLTTREAESYSA